jgi:hypothetical protein
MPEAERAHAVLELAFHGHVAEHAGAVRARAADEHVRLHARGLGSGCEREVQVEVDGALACEAAGGGARGGEAREHDLCGGREECGPCVGRGGGYGLELGGGCRVGERAAGEGMDGGCRGVCEQEGEDGGALGYVSCAVVWGEGSGRTTWPVLPARTADVIVVGSL